MAPHGTHPAGIQSATKGVMAQIEHTVDKHKHIADGVAVTTGFVAGTALNARYPDGISVGPIKNFKASSAAGITAVAAGVGVKKVLGMRRTGRALVVGGIGSGLASLADMKMGGGGGSGGGPKV
jgi:hypothetical protein